MKLYVTRESVCAGDDVDAPHQITLSVPDKYTLEDIARAIQRAGYLPTIQGGKATWSVVSGVPIAVMAQQWSEPKMLTSLDLVRKELDLSGSTIRVHVNYHAQIDPDIVYEILWGLRLKAI